MRDRRAERAVGGARRVDVDPLVVTRRVGEQVHLLLGDLVPLAVTQRLARGGRELVDAREDPHDDLLLLWPSPVALSSGPDLGPVRRPCQAFGPPAT